MRHISEPAADVFARFAQNILGIEGADDQAAARQGIERYAEWLNRIGAPRSFADIVDAEINDDALRKIAHQTYVEAGGEIGKLVQLDEDDVYRILQSCL